jgi:hypothetical protein
MSRKKATAAAETPETARHDDATNPANPATDSLPAANVSPPAGQVESDKVWAKLPDRHETITTAWPNGYKVHFQYSRQSYEWQIRFGDGSPQDKPPEAIRQFVGEEGLGWNSRDRAWGIRTSRANASEIADKVENVYHEVVKRLEADLGPAGGQSKQQPEPQIPF